MPDVQSGSFAVKVMLVLVHGAEQFNKDFVLNYNVTSDLMVSPRRVIISPSFEAVRSKESYEIHLTTGSKRVIEAIEAKANFPGMKTSIEISSSNTGLIHLQVEGLEKIYGEFVYHLPIKVTTNTGIIVADLPVVGRSQFATEEIWSDPTFITIGAEAWKTTQHLRYKFMGEAKIIIDHNSPAAIEHLNCVKERDGVIAIGMRKHSAIPLTGSIHVVADDKILSVPFYYTP
ncbi:MAG: hypothetical protein B7Z37_18190 [Verrucomicrobia bacterium 12-59-8]|nr:MAG: hypothetical protein B7Z37_18190 [Verrucomicrobia bacterium 12-59-8]